jgi:uncharacterized protein (DUF427 family)
MLLHEPGRYPVAYFPIAEVAPDVLSVSQHTSRHRELGATSWYTVSVGRHRAERASWQHTELPPYAAELNQRVAFGWRAMDGFYEEDERIFGHAADPYHRIDIRQTSRHLVVQSGDRVIADTTHPLVMFESGFAPRWYVPRGDVDERALTKLEDQSFCPYKGLCSLYDVGHAHQAAWSYEDAWPDAKRVSGMVSFEPEQLSVYLDGAQLTLAPGQTIVRHGADRDLSVDEASPTASP